MSGASHTPGPHRVSGKNTTTEVGGFNLVWGGGELLAYVARTGDARLYAAAHELLEALERLRNATLDDRQDISAARSVARAAIAKARGEA